MRTQRSHRRRLGAGLLVAGSVLAGVTTFSASPSAALDPGYVSEVVRTYHDENGGDLPECGPRNINGRGNTTGLDNAATWRVQSTRADGASVQVGDEWDIRGSVVGLGANSANDGPDPLVLMLPAAGPVVPAAMVGTDDVGPGEVFHGGDGFTGSVGPYNAYAWEFDMNSDPGLGETDGAEAQVTITLRAVAPGVVELPRMEVFGHDGTPIAGNFDCDFPVGFSWVVEAPPAPPFSGLDSANTDASYEFVNFDDANGGTHAIDIDVLANDDDPEVPGGPGLAAQVRVHDWQPLSVEGGTVSCGTGLQKGIDSFVNMSTGPCRYTPPRGYSGPDTFGYVVRSVTGLERFVNVSVFVKPNRAPVASPPELAMTLSQTIVNGPLGGVTDPDGDDVTCSLVTGPAGLTVDPDACTFDFDPAAAGDASFTYRACDEHTTLVDAFLGVTTERAPGYELGDPNDLSATTSRLCDDFPVTLTVVNDNQFLPLPPTALSDTDVVDAGYAADGIGAYSVEIPVLANDIDLNGPDPSEATWRGVLDPVDLDGIIEVDGVTAGTIEVIDTDGGDEAEGDLLRFTPADGFAGDVAIQYRVCENGPDQDQPYISEDDPETPQLESALCGLGTVAITVLPNEAPLAQDDEVLTASDLPVTDLDVAVNDSDPESGALACVPGPLVAVPAGLVESASIDADCLVDLTPVVTAEGVADLAYVVCDDHTLATPAAPADPYGADGRAPGDAAPRCSTAVLTATIARGAEVDAGQFELDPDPTCAADAASTAGTAIDVAVLANDSDLDAASAPSALAVSAAGIEGTEDVTTQGGAVAVTDDGQRVRYTPPAGFVGVDTFAYGAQDTAGQGCAATVSVTVTAPGPGPGAGGAAGAGQGTLPRTGGDGQAQALLGLGLAVLGAGLVLAGRERRPTTPG